MATKPTGLSGGVKSRSERRGGRRVRNETDEAFVPDVVVPDVVKAPPKVNPSGLGAGIKRRRKRRH